MIGSVMSGYRVNSPYPDSNRKTGSADTSFGETLAEMTEADALMAKAPDKWVTKAGSSWNVIKGALEFREKELGIREKDIEPTHELTPEQKAWLDQRHDFSSMRCYVPYTYKSPEGTTVGGYLSTAEYSNFLADLVYLGVFSKEDLVNMWMEPIDTRPGSASSNSILLNGGLGSENDLLGASRAFVSRLQNMFEFYNSRSKDPHAAVEGDAEFALLIKEHFLPLPKLFSEMIEELFGSENAELPRSSAVPPIEDASGKLKEDFGRALA